MNNPFHWNNGQPSIFWTQAGEDAAKRLKHAQPGKSLDSQGRAVVNKEPHRGQSITISKRGEEAERIRKLSKASI